MGRKEKSNEDVPPLKGGTKGRSNDINVANTVERDFDRTQPKEPKTELTDEEFRSFIEQVKDHAMFTIDLDGRPTSWNEGVRHVLGFEKRAFIGEEIILQIFSPQDIKAGVPEAELQEARRNGVASDDRWMRRSDDTAIWVSGTTNAIRDKRGRTIGYVKVMRDQTERKRMEESLARVATQKTAALEQRNQLLRQLANQTTEAEQHERERIARVLHDGLQQILVAAKLQLPTGDFTTGENNAVNVSQMLDEALELSRSLIFDLVPPCVHGTDVLESVQWLVDWFKSRHKLSISLRSKDSIRDVAQPIGMFVFNCVREILLNCVKHSGVTSASISISRYKNGSFRIVVADRGRGFDPAILETRSTQGTGLGLFSMVERAAALGGELQVRSSIGKGASFTLKLPIGEKRV